MSMTAQRALQGTRHIVEFSLEFERRIDQHQAAPARWRQMFRQRRIAIAAVDRDLTVGGESFGQSTLLGRVQFAQEQLVLRPQQTAQQQW